MYPDKTLITNSYRAVCPGSSGSQTPQSTSRRYSRNSGSYDVTGLQVPVLAYDDTSITLVWNKPENYESIEDYRIYLDGKPIGTARENFAKHADWAYTYMKAFYEHYENQDIEMVKADIHSYKAVGLQPGTSYHFSVIAVGRDGKELGTAATLDWATTPIPQVFLITEYGAKPTKHGLFSYNETVNQMIETNTRAIQAAIDACTAGGKVIIPEGIWVTGALYLHSNMTLELQEGAVLFGSPNADHYDRNYLLYPYSTDTRSWALINAYSSDEMAPVTNIRITGRGTIYGNGWKYGDGDSISGDGTSPHYQKQKAGDPAAAPYRLKQWMAGSNTKVYDSISPVRSYGILAADASMKAQQRGLSPALAYSCRPNLIVIRGAQNVYLEGITVENPAFHTIAVLDSQNVAAANIKYITYDANNADGIELGNTQNALVYNSFFDTGDDSINFATGLGKGVNDARQQPSRNIWTFNNFLRQGHGGAIAAGSHTGAGICEMLVEDNVINHSDIPFRFKSAPVNGGGASHVLIRDCAAGNASQLFVMTTIYNDENQTLAVEPADRPAEFHHIDAYHITADGITENTFFLVADVDYNNPCKPWHSHHNLYFQDIRITGVSSSPEGKAEVVTGIENSYFADVTVDSPRPWNRIIACRNLLFSGGTVSAQTAACMKTPEWDENLTFLHAEPILTNRLDESARLTWEGLSEGNSSENQIAGYMIETRLNGPDGPIIDKSGIIAGKTYVANGLCANTCYHFTVTAIGSCGSLAKGPFCTCKTPSVSKPSLQEPIDRSLHFEGTGCTWTTAVFSNASAADPRVRGYECTVNGKLIRKIYCYEIKDSRTSEQIHLTAGRLTELQNTIEITAFTDDNQRIAYETSVVTTKPKYSLHAPIWTGGLTIERTNDAFTLRWPEPQSENGVYAYRVYADKTPITNVPNAVFNPVNAEYTTKSTCITLNHIDPTCDHHFKVEAADAWPKSLEGNAPYHWTLSGPEYTYKGEMQ